MKLKTGMFAMILALTATARAATNDLTGLLQQGLFEEEANRNLDAAISDYQSLASDFDKDRQLAATAIFRLGECYRKLGRTNEAVVQYQRIIKEFSDQQTLATLSRQNLAGLNITPKPTADSAYDSTIAAAEESVESLKAQLTDLGGMSHDQQRIYVLQNFSNPVLTSLLQQLDYAQQKLLALKLNYTSDHPKIKTAQELVDDLNSKIDAQVVGVVHGLGEKLATAQIQLHLRQGQSQMAERSDGSSIRPQESTTTDDEQREIRNIQAMIQNSPDLINAAGGGVNGDRTPLMLAAEKGQLVVAKYLLDHGADVNGTGRGRVSESLGTPLFLAADNGRKAMVELLLARGADVNDNHGPNPLYQAVSKGFTGVVEVLLANKADVNLPTGTDTSGKRPLHAAALNGKTDLIQLLIDHGADVDATDNQGRTALGLVAIQNEPAVAKRLIAAKANLEIRNKTGNTALHEAAQAGSTAVASLLLDSGATVDSTNYANATPLLLAVVNGRADAARVLLEHKADPNHRGGVTQLGGNYGPQSLNTQPLFLGAAFVNPEILKSLLDAGANPEGDSAQPSGALAIAIGRNNVDAVQLLLQHGANPNRPENDGISPLNEAVKNRRETRIISMLLDKGADPNAQDSNGRPPLFNTSDPEIGRLLVQHKADVNARTAEGNTPMMSTGDTNYLEFLLDAGAKTDLQETNGNTALHFEAFNARASFVAILLGHNANPNIQNSAGYTPLDIARTGMSGSIPRSMQNPNSMPNMYLGTALYTREEEKQIADMLVKAGGLANLPKSDRIAVRRGSSLDYSMFSKSPRDWNRFSLLELIATDYGLISTVQSGDWSPRSGWADQSLPFPDFKKVVIYRRGSGLAKQTATEVNVEKILADGDCSRDVWLDWGDVVEIPEADHPVDEGWPGLSDSVVNALTNCVSRHVTIKIKNESTVLTLAPEGRVETQGRLEILRTRRFPGPGSSRPSFMLRSVLDNSKLIRVSSDLSRVKVTHHDPASKKTVEWTVDCTDPNQADLWLRDGDVIEVPEK